MKQQQRTDVSGLAIINHQRSIPPAERQNDKVFTPQQMEDAQHHDIVLMTTWELFRLVRGAMDFGWPFEVLQGLFYGKGRKCPIPSHWEPVGHVAHFYDKSGVVSILLEGTLKVGDKIGLLLPTRYVEEAVSSLQVEKEAVEEAVSGKRVGHKTTRVRSEMKDGLPVFVVREISPGASS